MLHSGDNSDPQGNSELSSETFDFQKEWEELIGYAQKSGSQATKELGKFRLKAGIEVTEILFVKPGFSAPEIGVALVFESGEKIEYLCKCFKGNPVEYGEILVAEPHIQASRVGMGITLPVNFAGARSMELSQRYDSAIVQALSNVTGERVLHSIVVDVTSPQRQFYLEQGYQVRRGHMQFLDKIFQPEV